MPAITVVQRKILSGADALHVDVVVAVRREARQRAVAVAAVRWDQAVHVLLRVHVARQVQDAKQVHSIAVGAAVILDPVEHLVVENKGAPAGPRPALVPRRQRRCRVLRGA